MPDTHTDLLDEANQDLKAKRNAQAVTRFRQVLARDPKNAPAYQGLGAGLALLGRYEDAEQACRMAIELDPTLSIPHQNLAYVLGMQKRYAECRPEAEEAIRLNPNAANAYVTLSTLDLMEGRLDEAEESLKRAAVVEPRNALVHSNLVACYMRQRRRDESLHEARVACRLSPSLVACYRVAVTFIARFPGVFWGVGVLITILIGLHSPIALPMIAILDGFLLPIAFADLKSGQRDDAVLILLFALLWVALYLYSQIHLGS